MKIGGANAPPTHQQSRGIATFVAFPRPVCGQVATPCWWYSLAPRFAFIFSWICSLSLNFNEMAFDLWLQLIDL